MTYNFRTEFNFNTIAKTGTTNFILEDRNYLPINSANTMDIYFKYQKCLDGICYSYINDINNIYKISLLTGDGNTLNNMYNEYNIIDKYLQNFHLIDIASDINIDTGITHYKIDNVEIKPNHKILLFNQDNIIDNDIYDVTQNYFLEKSDLLETTGTSSKSKFYIKLGTYKENQYFLENSGITFPITNEAKYFTPYHSYIIKHKFDYNITGDTASLIFTNYDIARTLKNNITEFETITFDFNQTGNTLDIKYLNSDTYNISNILDIGLFYISSGNTVSARTFDFTTGGTYFDVDSIFSASSSTNEHILITLYNTTATTSIVTENILNTAYLNYFTTIKSLDNNKLEINGNIPEYIYNNLSTGYSYKIRNLHFAESGLTQFIEYINASPYGKLITASVSGFNFEINVNDNDYYKYFDYNLLSFLYSESGVTETISTFSTDNLYANYNLETFINDIFIAESGTTPTTIYSGDILYSGEYTIEEIYSTLETYYAVQSSRYKITPLTAYLNKLEDFNSYTYIDFFATGDTSGRTMITEVTEDYMIIEKPYNDLTASGISSGIYDITNVVSLSGISDILMKVYLNYDQEYYKNKSDSERYRISGAYGQIIKTDTNILDYATGILYQDENDKFNLNIFNMIMNSGFTHIDGNLNIIPIELIDIGVDKKTMKPRPLELDNLNYNPYSISINTIISGVSCYNNQDGAIYVTASGGTLPYLYTITPTGYTNTTGIFENLTGGTYFVSVKDDTKSTASYYVTVNEPGQLGISSIDITDPTGYGNNDGFITINMSGGTLPYQYNLTGISYDDTLLEIIQINNNLLTGITASSTAYTLIISDANGCYISISGITVNQPAYLEIYSVSTTTPICPYTTNGRIQIYATGGIPQYQYSLSGDTGNYPIFLYDNLYENLTAGTYICWVKDSNGYENSAVTNIQEKQPITISASTINPSCNLLSDGMISVSGVPYGSDFYFSTGGSFVIGCYDGANYSYEEYFDLPNGVYNIYIIDYLSCISSTQITLYTEPIIFQIDIYNPTCTTCNNGLIYIHDIDGGLSPYQYKVEGHCAYQSSPYISGLTIGNWQVYIEDVSGCTSFYDFEMNEEKFDIEFLYESTPSCSLIPTGDITVYAFGGISKYRYTTGSTYYEGNYFGNLTGGTYEVSILDGDANEYHEEITIDTIENIITQITPTYNGGVFGITIDDINNGDNLSAYTFEIDDSSLWQTSNEFTGLTSATTFDFRVKDNTYGCESEATRTSTFVVISSTSHDEQSITIVEVDYNDDFGSYEFDIIDITGAGAWSGWDPAYEFTGLNPSNEYGLRAKYIADDLISNTISVTTDA